MVDNLKWSRRAAIAASFLMLVAGSSVKAAETAPAAPAAESADVATELRALRTRVAELEAKENQNWLTEERSKQIRGIVEDVLADARKRGQIGNSPDFGYNNGFFIQTPDKNFKLVVGGFVQIRYEFTQYNAYNGRTLPSQTINNGPPKVTTTPGDPGNSSGVDIRRARINFSGNAWTPNLTYKFEGDFYGNGTGNFTVTDAFVAYRFTDQIKMRVGSFKVPFLKTELTSDTNGTFMERPEAAAPFDAVRSLGVSLFGDLIADKLSYEVSMNDGGSTFNGNSDNNLRRVNQVGITPNIDNRMGFYARLQWAGNGKLSDFADESDLRQDNRDFIWMLGAAAGYESQNSTNNSFPSPQNSTTIEGVSNSSPGLTGIPAGGFVPAFALNGDIFRGTIDWSAKYQGWSFLTALDVQEINQHAGNTSTSNNANNPPTPFGTTDASFFQYGTYGQVGYFLIPHKFELAGRAGLLGTEGYSNFGEFYSLGANYYLYGNNLKIQSDVTFTPEAAYTDSAAALLQNTHDLTFRLQLQLRF